MSIQPEDVKLPLEALRTPVQLGPLTLKNAIVMASLTRSRATPVDIINDTNVEYYRQRAAGGAGLILSEGTLVSPQGSEWSHVASIYSNEHAEAWKKVTSAVHDEGGLIFAQLWHVGRIAHPDMPLHKKFGKPVSAPSPISARGGKFRQIGNAPNVAPEREHPNPRELVEEFKAGAIRAKEAGFDGVEFHGANGYLAQQFLDKNSNQRTDEWGGSVENRARFYVECLGALAEVWGADRVGIKLNPCGGFNDVGMNEQDTIESYTYVIKHCVALGLGYIQLVRYMDYFDAEYDGKKRSETHLDVLEHFGPLLKGTNTKLFLNGGVSAGEADGLVKEGKVDAVVIGRSFINNPDLVKRLFNHQPLNETFGHNLDPTKFYNFEKDIKEGYTDYPDYETAVKQKEEKEN